MLKEILKKYNFPTPDSENTTGDWFTWFVYSEMDDMKISIQHYDSNFYCKISVSERVDSKIIKTDRDWEVVRDFINFMGTNVQIKQSLEGGK